ncbi:hypothetical protein ACOMHN_023860 [Nucella lapillus]
MCFSPFKPAACVPHLYTCVPHLYTCVPHLYTCVPHLYSCVPYLNTCVPHLNTCVPHLYTCILPLFPMFCVSVYETCRVLRCVGVWNVLCSACTAGTYGEDCQQQCGKCRDNKCDDGFYGINCAQECGACADKAVCEKVTGYCPGDCAAQQVVPLCKTKRECKNQFYGDDCSLKCGKCTYPPCDKTSGNCTCPPEVLYAINGTRCQLCRHGYNPPLCLGVTQNVPSSGPSLIVLGLGLAVTFTFLTLAVTLALWLTRRRRKKGHNAPMMLRLQVPDAVPTIDPVPKTDDPYIMELSDLSSSFQLARGQSSAEMTDESTVVSSTFYDDSDENRQTSTYDSDGNTQISTSPSTYT